jgi:4-coumarate--CoA ligase
MHSRSNTPVCPSILIFPDSEHCLARPDTAIHISAANPDLALTVARARVLTEVTSSALRKHFQIGANGPGKDVVSVISTGSYLLPVLAYGIIGAGGVLSAASAASTVGELSKQIQGAESKVLCCVGGTKDVAVKAAEEAGWGPNGGGRVAVMGEEDWSLQIVQVDGQLGPDIIDETQKLRWERITNPTTLENSLIILIYSSGTTGLPKGTSCHTLVY